MAVSITGATPTTTFDHGNEVTIAGSGFTAKATAAPALWDTVDNRAEYSALNDGDAIPLTLWTANPENDIKFETSDAQRHSHGTAHYKGTDTGSLAGSPSLGSLTISGATELYISWWFKSNLDLLLPTDAHSSKFIRMNSSSFHQNPGRETLSWTQTQFIVFDDPTFHVNISPDQGMTPVDTWHFIEFYANQTSGNHTYWARKNGSTLWTNTGNTGPDWNWDFIYILGFDRGGVSPPNPVINVDDVYIDKVLNRVMIGDASTYAASTHFEMQIPTAWADGSITATINQGSFGASDTAYVYVLDSANLVNANGFEITFGAAGGAPAAASSRGSMSLNPKRMVGLTSFRG